ncbi:hypothetical protein ACOMHN_057027 [Nucella lapillus]
MLQKKCNPSQTIDFELYKALGDRTHRLKEMCDALWLSLGKAVRSVYPALTLELEEEAQRNNAAAKVEEAESEQSQSFSRGAGKRRGKSSSPSPPPQLALLPKTPSRQRPPWANSSTHPS